jgi:hypothetical protein
VSVVKRSASYQHQNTHTMSSCIPRSWHQGIALSKIVAPREHLLKDRGIRMPCITKTLHQEIKQSIIFAQEIMHSKVSRRSCISKSFHQDLALIEHALQDRCTKRICIPVVASRDHALQERYIKRSFIASLTPREYVFKDSCTNR